MTNRRSTLGLEVCDVESIAANSRGATTLLDGVSLSAPPGSLTAVIGPSGAGKSTLARVIAGASRPTRGTVSLDGIDVHADRASLRTRIGVVPQDDIVHQRLTVARALRHAAELRMPTTSSENERRLAVANVLAELDLTDHAGTRVDALSGGQRKRVSIALELLTGPSLLVLDEPTTGLDPALDRQVMTVLRRLADAGRVVVVITHSLTFLDVCDQVLLLAPGGRTVFTGTPRQLGPALGSTDWADVYAGICADPIWAQRRYLDGRATGLEPATEVMTHATRPMTTVATPQFAGFWRQWGTLVRRQVQLLAANRGYVAFLAALPLVVGLLPLTVMGHAGFNAPDPGAPLEPKHVIALLDFAAVLMGTTLTVRDLLGERGIYCREHAAGMSATAYLAAKLTVFGAIAALQSAVLVLVVTAPGIGKPAPIRAAALGDSRLELFVAVAATCVAASVLGLALSATAKNGDRVIMLLAAALAAQLVLAGGFIPVTGRPALELAAAFTPARWGFAATASTSDLSNLVVGVARDAHWRHAASVWWFDMAMLAALGVACAVWTRWRLRARATVA